MKNEEILKIEDLVDGGYYKATFKENPKGLIFLLNNKIGENYYHYFINLEDNYFQKDYILTSRPEENIYTKLNQKEIFWLNECIKANKFINYETAMKTFVEEDKLYDITNLTPYPENYRDCKRGDKVILVNYTSKTSNDAKIPLGSVLIIDQDNNSIPFVLYKKQRYCVSICQVAPIPNEEQKEESPKYVEYIETQFKGQIVKVEDWTPHTYCKVIFSDGTKEQPFKHLVKETTKEDFDKQELLEEAKRRYPIGCTIDQKSAYGKNGGKYTINNHNSCDMNNYSLWIGGVGVYCFDSNKWVEIVKEPKKEINMKECDYEVVHCITREQFSFVIKKQNSPQNVTNWDTFKEKTCFLFKIINKYDGYDQISFFQNKNSKIYTFSEWCKLNNYVMEEEWTPIVGEWVWDNLHEHCLQIIEISKQENLRLKDQGWTYKKQCRPALPHEIPNNQSNQTIDIGDEVSTYDGNGIVIGIDDSNNYLIKGAKKQHKGSVSSYIKGGPSDEKDSYFYSKDQITLVKKANNNTATRIDTARELGLVFIDTNVPSTKEILKFEIYNQKPSIKKEEFIELNINLTKNIKKPIKL